MLINQHVANTIRHLLSNYSKTIPTVLEMPSKDAPYDLESAEEVKKEAEEKAES